jgi:hypothetical protein
LDSCEFHSSNGLAATTNELASMEDNILTYLEVYEGLVTKIFETYRWNIGIASRKEDVEEKEIIMVRSSFCSYYYSPQKIHSEFIDAS